MALKPKRLWHAIVGHRLRSERREQFGMSEWWAICDDCGYRELVYLRILDERAP